MFIPIHGVLPHELGDDREDRESIERQVVASESQSWRDIYVMNRGLCWLWSGHRFNRKVRKRGERGIIREGAGVGYRDIDLNVLVEIGLQSTTAQQPSLLNLENYVEEK